MVTRSPGTPAGTKSSRNSGAIPIRKNGPTVCEQVTGSVISLLHWCRVAPAQHNVELVAQRLLRNRGLPIERGNQPRAPRLVRDALKDRVERQQGIAWKIH